MFPSIQRTGTLLPNGMAEVTQPGLYHTAGSAHLEGIDIAGKTGTAQQMSHEALGENQQGAEHLSQCVVCGLDAAAQSRAGGGGAVAERRVQLLSSANRGPGGGGLCEQEAPRSAQPSAGEDRSAGGNGSCLDNARCPGRRQQECTTADRVWAFPCRQSWHCGGKRHQCETDAQAREQQECLDGDGVEPGTGAIGRGGASAAERTIDDGPAPLPEFSRLRLGPAGAAAAAVRSFVHRSPLGHAAYEILELRNQANLLGGSRCGHDVYFCQNRLPSRARLGAVGIRVWPFGPGRGVIAPWTQGAGRPALDQARANAGAAFRVCEAGADFDRRPLFCQSRRAQCDVEGASSRLSRWSGFPCCWC